MTRNTPTRSPSTLSDRTAALRDLPKKGSGGRKIVPLPSRGIEMPTTVERAAIAVKAWEDSRGRILFRKGPEYVGLTRGEGRPKLEEISVSAFQTILQQRAEFATWRWAKDRWVLDLVHSLSKSVCETILEGPPFRMSIPQVENLVFCPIITKTGTIISDGFVPELRTLVVGRCKSLPDVPIDQAVRDIREILADFNPVSDGDRSRLIAFLISPALRLGGIIRNGPIDCFEADKSATGKGTCVELRAAIYNDAVTIVTQRQGGTGSVDESIGAALLAGNAFISLDNFRGSLDSRFLEAAVTEGEVQARLPYSREIPVQACRYMISLASNGVEFTTDFANRTNITRLRKQPTGYAFRRSKSDLIAYARERSPHFIGCIFSVVKHWITAGKPTANNGWDGHFREWWEVMDWILPNVFGLPAPSLGQIEAAGRVSSPALMLLRNLVLEITRSGPVSPEGYTSSDLVNVAFEANPSIQLSGRSARDYDEDSLARQIGVLFKNLFENGSVNVDEFRVTRTESVESRRGTRSGPKPVVRYHISRNPRLNATSATSKTNIFQNEIDSENVGSPSGASGEDHQLERNVK